MLQPSTSIEQTQSILTGTQPQQLQSQTQSKPESQLEHIVSEDKEQIQVAETEIKPESYNTCEKTRDHTFKQQQTLLNTLKDCKTRTIRVEDLIQKVNKQHDIQGSDEE